jgi:hypothetical protein
MPLALPANGQLTLAPYSGFSREPIHTDSEAHENEEVSKTMLENRSAEKEGGLLVRAEPLDLAEKISDTIVAVVRIEDGALLLDADPSWAGAINEVLVKKGVRVSELASSSRYISAAQPTQN